ncbi:MAG: EMC3/TMCO1 family protein [Candidatus Methylarchaceae archaeon HK01B]|nr:EMC3/TMCO1 family protein [Candidatus Methylarchaceae archaeon HK01M]MCP8312219.1 EMC3/TMCO1 family protein [Candidatus Methylarchaceae archaeon HK02M1]MCP8318746.1 EMC3/TMCO1 family protein [Candidatus Methylarchaceae archaeon HK01B]
MVDPTAIPISTLLVTAVALTLNLTSNVVTRLFTDVDRARRINAEVKAFRDELKQATLTKDKAKERKLRKREKQMMELQMKVTKERMKPMLLFWVPFIAVYYLLATFLGGYDAIVAISPIPIDLVIINIGVPIEGGYGFSLFWWYLISSFAFSAIVMKLLKTSPT